MLFSGMAKLLSVYIVSHRELSVVTFFSLQKSTCENIDRPTGGLSVIAKGNKIVEHWV